MPTRRAAPHEEIAVLKILKRGYGVFAAGFRNPVADQIGAVAVGIVVIAIMVAA